jgi:hypothetical protein
MHRDGIREAMYCQILLESIHKKHATRVCYGFLKYTIFQTSNAVLVWKTYNVRAVMKNKQGIPKLLQEIIHRGRASCN